MQSLLPDQESFEMKQLDETTRTLKSR